MFNTIQRGGFNGYYCHHYPGTETVRYDHVPAIDADESISDYAERVADFVNVYLGRRVSLSAKLND